MFSQKTLNVGRDGKNWEKIINNAMIINTHIVLVEMGTTNNK